MKAFKQKGDLTKFQILSEIARNQPHIRQKDIAKEMNITVQAVSENIKYLIEQGYLDNGNMRSHYTITKKGIQKIKKEAQELRNYSEDIIETMNTYKTVWPAIAHEDLNAGDIAGLYMDGGNLYASKTKSTAYAEVIRGAKMGEDVTLINVRGIVKLKPGNVCILTLPNIQEGGSRNTNTDKIIEIFEEKYDRVGIMGTVTKVVVDQLDIKPDFEFATPKATIAASKRGLDVLILVVGKMKDGIIKKLEEEGIPYTLEDVRKV